MINKLGTFKATKDGLVEIPPKPVMANIDGEDIIIYPENSMYNTIVSYGKTKPVDEGYGSQKDADGY
jgi:hypothetical protein